jgi:pimeloyl-ACP methyl ester carboxylesterase
VAAHPIAAARRSFLAAALAAAAWAVSGCATAPPPARPPIVLVHGAWSDASAWDRVAAELRQRGHAVTAVNLPGHGADPTPPERLTLAGYADAVLAALPAGAPAVLVGHSMAGMVISLVAERAPERVARLVYVAAYLPANGQSLYELSMTDPDSLVGRYWRQADEKAYTPASIAGAGIAEVFCADCSAADQARLVDGHRAEAVPPLGTPVQLSAARFGSVARVYVHTTQDKAVSYTLQKAMLVRAGGASAVVTLDTSHMPMLTRPRALADAIEGAAR